MHTIMVIRASNNDGFSDGQSLASSKHHDIANQEFNLRSGSFSGGPRNRQPCRYFLRGSKNQDVSSIKMKPLTRRTTYDSSAQRRQEDKATSRNLHFDREIVVGEDSCLGVRPCQDIHVGDNVPLNGVGFYTHHKAGQTKEHFVCNSNVDSGSRSSRRKRSWPGSDFGGDQQKPEVCRNFTKGRCKKGVNCTYMHNIYEYGCSISQERQKPHLVAHQENDTSDIYVIQSNDCKHTKSSCVSQDNSFQKETKGQSSPPCKRHRSKSSKIGADSIIEEVADTSLKRLPNISSMRGTSLDYEHVMPVARVTDDLSTSVPKTVIVGDVLAKDCQVEEKEHRAVIVEVHHTKTKLLKPSLQLSQPSDTSMQNSSRKLLVLDVNGLLVDIVANFPPKFKPEFKIKIKGVFKRPFCDDFLQFCFEKFDVGIWSSRAKKNLTKVVDLLMKNTKQKLLFCWHQSECTETGFKTLDNKVKPLVLKELSKLWGKEQRGLRWKRGVYDESNTILVDDSPYKALRNPPYTAVFPFSYSVTDVQDKSLGPGGDLRLYLERLAAAENVQKFIEANPFGQRPITKSSRSWSFYSKIAGKYAIQPQKGTASTGSDQTPSTGVASKRSKLQFSKRHK